MEPIFRLACAFPDIKMADNINQNTGKVLLKAVNLSRYVKLCGNCIHFGK